MANPFNRRKFLGYGAATAATSLLLKACSPGATPEATTEKATATQATAKEASSLAIVLPGTITDGGWNQLGYEGVKRAGDELGLEVAYVEQVKNADQTEALTDFARQGYSLVVGHGGQFDAAIEQVAAQFPETFFLGVNGDIVGDNYACVRTNYNQMLYLSGMIGAAMSTTKKMAYLAGMEFKSTQQQGVAMDLGAKAMDPSAEVVSSFVGDFNDIAKAKESALALISSGVDVIFHNLDKSAPAVLKACEEAGVYAFGNNIDQFDLAPEAILTSAIQDIGGAISMVAGLAGKGEIEGKKYVIGLETPELVRFGTFNEAVPEEVRAQVETVAADMVAGKLTFEDAEENGKAAVRLVTS
ncbi:basic membrane lipoprotein [Leptolyngbya sp. Heron Island J]|uniref:BMP family protein n=1 Tax=Leptolyngbya sp. Heron Island J TaxID=1385935 RepID=UPI0003B938F5|nr:BMP family protein [Leptolyngbya sp. Heron Island J]ESA33778.1 basic membrane lipoprotein [Leptolyngbya sp. Heron Island J]